MLARKVRQFSGAWILYLIGGVIVFFFIDYKVIATRVMNHNADCAEFLMNYATGHEEKDPAQLLAAARFYKYQTVLMPENKYVYTAIGYAYHSLGYLNRAIHYYREFLDFSPDMLGVYYNLGILYAKKGKKEQAEFYWKEAKRINPNPHLDYAEVAAPLNISPGNSELSDIFIYQKIDELLNRLESEGPEGFAREGLFFYLPRTYPFAPPEKE